MAYNLFVLVAFPWLIGWLHLPLAVPEEGPGVLAQQAGTGAPRPKVPGPRIWLHAVSAGRDGGPAAGGRAAARGPAEGLPGGLYHHPDRVHGGAARRAANAGAIFYLPFDWVECIALALRRVRPDLMVVTERELWPNFLGLARFLGVEVLLVNGRVSDHQRLRARWMPWVERGRYQLPSCLCVQSEEDAAGLIEMGVPKERVVVAGNTKADTMGARNLAAEEALAQALGATPEESWLVAGSTHPGEEEIVLAAFARIRQRVPARAPAACAPAPGTRGHSVCARVTAAGFPVARRSEGTPSAEAVVVLDTMGELRSAYALGPVGFVGGTLAPIGGHNLLGAGRGRPGRAVRPAHGVLRGRGRAGAASGRGFPRQQRGDVGPGLLRVVSEPPLRAAPGDAGTGADREPAGRLAAVRKRGLRAAAGAKPWIAPGTSAGYG